MDNKKLPEYDWQTNGLRVYLYGKPIGTLFARLPKNKRILFQYTGEQLKTPIGLRKSKYTVAEDNDSYFSHLFPDNPHQLNILKSNPRFEADDIFELLINGSNDYPGALEFCKFGTSPISTQEFGKAYHSLEELLESKDTLPAPLPGLNDKKCIIIMDNKYHIPTTNTPSTHIIKCVQGGRTDLINEYFCLKLAQAIGINSAECALHGPFLISKRFDRIIEQEKITKLHQETFLQSLGLDLRRPIPQITLNNCYQLMREVNNKTGVKDFLKYHFYNILIGNTDAHIKNYSILYDLEMNPTLAPIYDSMCRTVNKTIHDVTNQKILFGNKEDINDISHQDFQIESISAKIDYEQFMQIFNETAEGIHKNINNINIAPALINEIETDFITILKNHIKRRLDVFDKKLCGYNKAY